MRAMSPAGRQQMLAPCAGPVALTSLTLWVRTPRPSGAKAQGPANPMQGWDAAGGGSCLCQEEAKKEERVEPPRLQAQRPPGRHGPGLGWGRCPLHTHVLGGRPPTSLLHTQPRAGRWQVTVGQAWPSQRPPRQSLSWPLTSHRPVGRALLAEPVCLPARWDPVAWWAGQALSTRTQKVPCEPQPQGLQGGRPRCSPSEAPKPSPPEPGAPGWAGLKGSSQLCPPPCSGQPLWCTSYSSRAAL